MNVSIDDQARDDVGLIQQERSYPIWSPDRAFSAAARLLKALEDHNDESSMGDAIVQQKLQASKKSIESSNNS